MVSRWGEVGQVPLHASHMGCERQLDGYPDPPPQRFINPRVLAPCLNVVTLQQTDCTAVIAWVVSNCLGSAFFFLFNSGRHLTFKVLYHHLLCWSVDQRSGGKVIITLK